MAIQSTPHVACECWFLDVGQGTSNVILLGGGRAIVIDCGPHGSQQTIQLLLRRYVDTIEALIISHNDADHDFNVPQVLQQYRKATKNIFFLHDRPVSELCRTFGVLQSAPEGDYPPPRRLEVDADLPQILFSENGIELSALYPDFMTNLEAHAQGVNGPNRTSAVLRLLCGGRRIVFSADATIEAWEYLAAKMPEEKPLPCDIMTVPHHGGKISGDSTREQIHQTRLYTKLVKPQYAVISVGTSNPYGHPKRETLDALAKAGVKVLCTQMTEVCSVDLEAARSMRGILADPSRSAKQASKTQSGRSKDVACFGSVVTEISDTCLQISGLNRYEQSIAKASDVNICDPACRC